MAYVNPVPGQHVASTKPGLFATTHWSVVLEAGQGETPQARVALEQLCQTYWYPVYAFVRRKGYDQTEAEDLTQGFFTRILAGSFLRSADPKKGKFRSFLLGALDHFLAKEWARARRQKRGGGAPILSLERVAETRYRLEPAHDLTPERLFERRWALTLLEQAMDRLRAECSATGRGNLFENVEGVLSGDKVGFSYAEAASRTEMKEEALRKAVQRLRQRYGELLREQIVHTLSDPAEIEEEIQHIIEVLND